MVLAKWLSAHLRTKWFWVRIPLLSRIFWLALLQIPIMFQNWESKTWLPKFTGFIKSWYRPECRWTFENTWVTHITLRELHAPAWIWPSGSLIPNIYKQNIKRNETVVFWWFLVYSLFLLRTQPLGFEPLTIITKCSILDAAAVLDPPLVRVKTDLNLFALIFLTL